MSRTGPPPARLAALRTRAAILRAMRDYFAGEGFLEVETPARVPSPGQEPHLEAFPAGGDRFLITSPEYHMKRLVAAGAGRIVQIGRAFRAGELGPQHQPEFTIVEWYRPEEPLDAVARDCERLVEAAARAAGAWPHAAVPDARAARQGERIDLRAPFERATVIELLRRHAGVELTGDEDAAALRAKLTAAGVDPGGAAAYDDLFFQAFLDRVEPRLGRGRPTFVFDWPAPLGALARRRADDPRFVERFELYAAGLELANAFGELADPVEQRARFAAEATERRARGKPVYPIDERLLAALAALPPTAGIALGFDRLVMLVTGAAALRDVVAFADDEV